MKIQEEYTKIKQSRTKIIREEENKKIYGTKEKKQGERKLIESLK